MTPLVETLLLSQGQEPGGGITDVETAQRTTDRTTLSKGGSPAGTEEGIGVTPIEFLTVVGALIAFGEAYRRVTHSVQQSDEE